MHRNLRVAGQIGTLGWKRLAAQDGWCLVCFVFDHLKNTAFGVCSCTLLFWFCFWEYEHVVRPSLNSPNLLKLIALASNPVASNPYPYKLVLFDLPTGAWA
ncbi:unnamed protein product [Durusdinium trenchii]|uniref:Uncharacterized protein n=1 Tax=Durusdinium trenchii TaxID=1381693 RepID=A0ABP0NIA8_9DINO